MTFVGNQPTIDCRTNDKPLFLEPDKEGYQQMLADRTKAINYCIHQNGIARYMKEHKKDIVLTQVDGLMISYGRKSYKVKP